MRKLVVLMTALFGFSAYADQPLLNSIGSNLTLPNVVIDCAVEDGHANVVLDLPNRLIYWNWGDHTDAYKIKVYDAPAGGMNLVGDYLLGVGSLFTQGKIQILSSEAQLEKTMRRWDASVAFRLNDGKTGETGMSEKLECRTRAE